MNTDDFNKRLSKNIMRLSTAYPFFTTLINYMDFREDNSIPTMGVNREGVCVYNKEFVSKLQESEFRGVILHEVLHLVYNHLYEDAINGKDKDLYNIATDLKVNETITKDISETTLTGSIKLPNGAIVPDFYDEYKGFGTKIEEVDKKNSQQIYKELEERADKQQKYEGFDNHDFTGDLKNEKVRNGKELSQNEVKEFWNEKIIEASELQKMRGDLPGFIKEILKIYEAPKLDWRDILQNLIAGYDVSDYTWVRRHKNSRAIDVYLPDTEKEGMKARVYLDISGSVSNEELVSLIRDLNGVFSEFSSAEVDLITFDTEIKQRFNFTEEVNKIEFKGRGGTDFEEIFKDEGIEDQDFIIIMTDAGDNYPRNRDNYQGEIIWCITKGNSYGHLQEKESNGVFIEVD